MPKIAFVANSSWSLWRFRMATMRAMNLAGFEIIIIAPRDAKTSVLKQSGFQFLEIKVSRKGLNPIFDMFTFIRIFFLYKKNRPDFIFHYTIKPNIYGTLAASLLGIRSIAVVTGLGSVYLKDNWLTKVVTMMYRSTLKYAYQIWFLNASDALDFASRKILDDKRPSHGFILGSEGVNLSEFAPRTKTTSAFVFLFVGRMLIDKGVLDFVEAARKVRKTRLDVEFRLLGPLDPGNPSGLTRNQIRNLEDSGDVKYLGERDDVRNEIADADCIVLPTRYKEGMPRVLMEAAAMAKPVLTTNIAGCRDIVVDNMTGFLFEPGNSAELAAAMLRFLNLSEIQKRQMGERARERASKNYDENQVALKYIAVATALTNNAMPQ